MRENKNATPKQRKRMYNQNIRSKLNEVNSPSRVENVSEILKAAAGAADEANASTSAHALTSRYWV